MNAVKIAWTMMASACLTKDNGCGPSCCDSVVNFARPHGRFTRKHMTHNAPRASPLHRHEPRHDAKCPIQMRPRPSHRRRSRALHLVAAWRRPHASDSPRPCRSLPRSTASCGRPNSTLRWLGLALPYCPCRRTRDSRRRCLRRPCPRRSVSRGTICSRVAPGGIGRTVTSSAGPSAATTVGLGAP